jgi:RimJ/RimL family protein N-acetyltransferase
MREYFIKTERIGFSTWNIHDIEYAQLLWGNSEVTRYICASGSFTKHDVKNRLDKEIDNQNEFHIQYWPIFCLDGGNFIGCCGLRPYSLEDGAYEIGFHLQPDYWGKGLGTEAAKAVIDYAFTTLKANDLFAGHHPNNIGSTKILKKLGFHHTHDEYYEPTGLNHPSYRYIQ